MLFLGNNRNKSQSNQNMRYYIQLQHMISFLMTHTVPLRLETKKRNYINLEDASIIKSVIYTVTFLSLLIRSVVEHSS